MYGIQVLPDFAHCSFKALDRREGLFHQGYTSDWCWFNIDIVVPALLQPNHNLSPNGLSKTVNKKCFLLKYLHEFQYPVYNSPAIIISTPQSIKNLLKE